jgi:hypothetical protein
MNFEINHTNLAISIAIKLLACYLLFPIGGWALIAGLMLWDTRVGFIKLRNNSK